MARSAVEDYVKSVYKLSLENKKVTPSHVADSLGVTQAAVSKMVRRLQDLKLLNYDRSKGLRLSRTGEKVALEVIRHHRLLELYLTEALGFSWDTVHEEAERLEHVISEEFEEKIEVLLGYPTHDPHGAPIPTRDGQMELGNTTMLSELDEGQSAVIARVSDSDAKMLSHLGGLGMYPGTAIEMIERDPYGGSLHIKVSGKQCSLGPELARKVFVTLKGSDE